MLRTSNVLRRLLESRWFAMFRHGPSTGSPLLFRVALFLRFVQFMDSCELVQVAALVARHAALLIHANAPFPDAAIERYWTAGKCRQDSWARALKQFAAERQEFGGLSDQAGLWIRPVLAEVLTAEILSRIWAAASELADANRGTVAAGPIAQNILAGHLEARNRVLNLMVYGYGLRVEEAVALNRLRLRNERWTDTLLSLIGPDAARSRWCFQPQVVRRLAGSLRQRDTTIGNDFAKSLLLATLYAAYQHGNDDSTSNAEYNRQIASSIIACFPPHLFDSTGQLTSSRQLSLLQSTPDTQGRLDISKARPKATSEDQSRPKSGDGFRRFDLR